MIYQGNIGLSERFRKWGCFIRSCGIIAELEMGKELTVYQLNQLEEHALLKGWVEDETYKVVASAPIIRTAFDLLGAKRRVTEVATSVGNVITFYPSIKDPFRPTQAHIQKIKQSGPSGTHFRVIKDDGSIVDPHEPIIRSLGELYCIHYRIEE